MVFGGATVQLSSTVRDLGVILDSEMSFGPHINQMFLKRSFKYRYGFCTGIYTVELLAQEADRLLFTKMASDQHYTTLFAAKSHSIKQINNK